MIVLTAAATPSYDIYRYLFLGGAGMSALMLLVTIILFFALNIPHVIGDLSGANAKKAIARIRSQNENGAVHGKRSGQAPKHRGKGTELIAQPGRPQPGQPPALREMIKTEKIETEVLLAQAQEAQSRYETSGNPYPAQSWDQGDFREQSPADETVVLSSFGSYHEDEQPAEPSQPSFEIEFEITYIHSDVII